VMSGVSIGISLYPADGEDADTLMKKADLAMYHAKESGRNDFRLFDPAINAQSLKRLDLEAGLKRALRRGELALSWEPQYALADRAVVGLEAHVWWRDPIRGRLEAADFAGVAEETGIATGIFDWTLEAVCTQLDAWRRSGEMLLPVSISASLHQIEHSELLRDPAAVLAAHGLPPSALRLCVTDLAASNSAPTVLARLRQLDALGIAVDLDSLGSGPLDVPKLRQVPVRRVRIDARLVERLAERGDPARPLKALVSLARGLGLAIAVTAVASEKIAGLFAAAGVEHAQGPFYGSAVQVSDVPRMVAVAPSA
jgi:predicted signal transduction protein with EAL and GGDEF domain